MCIFCDAKVNYIPSYSTTENNGMLYFLTAHEKNLTLVHSSSVYVTNVKY